MWWSHALILQWSHSLVMLLRVRRSVRQRHQKMAVQRCTDRELESTSQKSRLPVTLLVQAQSVFPQRQLLTTNQWRKNQEGDLAISVTGDQSALQRQMYIRTQYMCKPYYTSLCTSDVHISISHYILHACTVHGDMEYFSLTVHKCMFPKIHCHWSSTNAIVVKLSLQLLNLIIINLIGSISSFLDQYYCVHWILQVRQHPPTYPLYINNYYIYTVW
jgi:hypothetical protein